MIARAKAPKQNGTSQPTDGRYGIGVDAFGGPVMDPTENVLALTEAANKRQDDLRELNNARIDARLQHLHEIADLRAEHAKEIGALESSRVNAIRQVDVLAVSTAADRAQAAIQALASVTAANAENLRNALNTTATTIATQLATTVAQITERIAALEKSSYKGEGKQAVADPMMAETLTEVKKLRNDQNLDRGKGAGFNAGWVYLLGGIGALASILGMLVLLYHIAKAGG